MSASRMDDNYTIVAGEYNLSDDDKTEQRYRVDKIKVHEKYNIPVNNSNDIALLKIAGNFTFNNYVKPIALATPQQDKFIDGNKDLRCMASGWGANTSRGPSQNILQAAVMPLEPLQECKKNASEGSITDDMLCAGYTSEIIGTCHGDSGGPLACLVDEKWTLIGVVSFGLSKQTFGNETYVCGDIAYHDMFARVSAAYEWIMKKITQN